MFLTPTLAEKLIPDQPPDYKETHSYVSPDSRRIGLIVGDNNLGAVSLRMRDGVVAHRLLARDRLHRRERHPAVKDAERPEAALLLRRQ